LDGIQAQFRGFADTAPRVRFLPSGEQLWEFNVRLIDSLTTTTETLTVRVPDQRYGQLARWVVPGRQLLVRGTLHVARWQGKAERERVRLVVEPTLEVMPLDESVQGSEPAALDYTDRRMPQPMAIPPKSTALSSEAERAARVRALLEETHLS
jgi:single-stranded DNA-binding protein